MVHYPVYPYYDTDDGTVVRSEIDMGGCQYKGSEEEDEAIFGSVSGNCVLSSFSVDGNNNIP